MVFTYRNDGFFLCYIDKLELFRKPHSIFAEALAWKMSFLKAFPKVKRARMWKDALIGIIWGLKPSVIWRYLDIRPKFTNHARSKWYEEAPRRGHCCGKTPKGANSYRICFDLECISLSLLHLKRLCSHSNQCPKTGKLVHGTPSITFLFFLIFLTISIR